MEAVTYTHARQNMAQLMDEVIDNSEIKIITRKKDKAVVMMSLKDYNSIEETCYLLLNPANREHLQESLEQDKKGETVRVRLEDL